MGKEAVLKFMKGAASVIPESINDWSCVFVPEKIVMTGAIVLPFYFLDAHNQLDIHVTATANEIENAPDPFAMGADRAKRALNAAVNSGFFNEKPNYLIDGKVWPVLGARLKSWVEAA